MAHVSIPNFFDTLTIPTDSMIKRIIDKFYTEYTLSDLPKAE